MKYLFNTTVFGAKLSPVKCLKKQNLLIYSFYKYVPGVA